MAAWLSRKSCGLTWARSGLRRRSSKARVLPGAAEEKRRSESSSQSCAPLPSKGAVTRLAESRNQQRCQSCAVPADEGHLAHHSRIHPVVVRAWHTSLRHHGHADSHFCLFLPLLD